VTRRSEKVTVKRSKLLIIYTDSNTARLNTSSSYPLVYKNAIPIATIMRVTSREYGKYLPCHSIGCGRNPSAFWATSAPLTIVAVGNVSPPMTMVIVVVTVLNVGASVNEGTDILDTTIETMVDVMVLVIGCGESVPLNNMQPFSEHAVPLGQQPPPTVLEHSNVDAGHWGGRFADGWQSEGRPVILQQKMPEVVYEAE
jgi:hypothetical protein